MRISEQGNGDRVDEAAKASKSASGFGEGSGKWLQLAFRSRVLLTDF
jgi:hypothetical protein